MNEVVIDLYLHGYNPTSISKILNMSRSNIYYILKGGVV